MTSYERRTALEDELTRGDGEIGAGFEREPRPLVRHRHNRAVRQPARAHTCVSGRQALETL
jgi:hypothetical protein